MRHDFFLLLLGGLLKCPWASWVLCDVRDALGAQIKENPKWEAGGKMKISRAYIVRGCLQAPPATLLCWVAYIKGFILCNTSALVIVLLSLCVSLCMNKKNSKLIVIWVFFFLFLYLLLLPGWLSCWDPSPLTAALWCAWWASVWPQKPLSGSPAAWLL